MKITIVRHGETEWNKEGIIQGQLDSKLSELGIEQAKKLAERLSNESFDAIFSSDLSRAADTAKEVAKFHLDVPIYFTQELRERYLGEFQGKTKDYPGWKDRRGDEEFMKKMGIEDTEKMQGRIKIFLDRIQKDFQNKKVLIVAHGGINKVIVGTLTGEIFHELPTMKNTAINVFELIEKEFKPIVLNCVKHLE